MARFFQSLARASWSRGVQPAVAAAFIAFAPALWAAEEAINFQGKTIWVEGVSATKWVGDTELILVYSNAAPDAVNTLRTENPFEARMLLVGGGGAGGGGTTDGWDPGGGGGGGQVLDLENSGYPVGTYRIVVGAGGANTLTQTNGENGHPSAITNGISEVAKALGGGGGGAKANGNGGDTVATGGGGSGMGRTGGIGTLGENHKGGGSSDATLAGGGGGAGDFGKDSTQLKAGDGGAGAGSSIWDDEGDVRWYGGGGGGGHSAGTQDNKRGLGGIGGGGIGGRRGRHGEDAVPGTGGGGGGGGWGSGTYDGQNGGAGGSGIVIIRLTYIEQTIDWVRIAVPGGGSIEVNSTATITNDQETSDIIITYTDVNSRGGLRFSDSLWATARILAVGGGGGGGFIGVRDNGAGGGGGAGGFIEEEGFSLGGANEYWITVGKGGAGGTRNEESGRDGGNSSVLLKGGKRIMSATAVGGGGGGAHGASRNGGSGGGGSRAADGSDQRGGDGIQGLGFNGGFGADTYKGAGGGGAGGPGGDARNGVGAGGDGRMSSITGLEICYAGGGGGAWIREDQTGGQESGGAGGSGGGGNGAGVTNNVVMPAQDGVDGLGGGGGGGISYVGAGETAGRGGNGIVIIRLSGFEEGGIPKPKSNGPFSYDGEAHRGVDEFYAYTLSGMPVATNANVYTVIATLKNPGMSWKGGGKEPVVLTWKILQAANAIEKFYYPGYSVDRLAAHHPTNQFEAVWGKDTAIVDYRPEGAGDWQPWGEAGPSAKGNYEVRLSIPPCSNWAGATNIIAFGSWEKLSDIFSDRMTVTVSGNTSGSTELKDFPVPIRVREPEKDGYFAYSGFQYVRAGSTGREIRFFDALGDPVEHDVDVWDTRGESLVWVRVPSLVGTATKLTMCWRHVGEIRVPIPDYDGTAVWRRNYAAVWHMTKLEGSHIADATGNGLSLQPTGGSNVRFGVSRLGRQATVLGGELRAKNGSTNIVVATDGKTVDEARIAKTELGSAWEEMEKRIMSQEVCAYGLVIREEQLCDWWTTTPSVTEITKEGTPPTVVMGKFTPTAGGGADTAVTVAYRAMPDGEWQAELPTAIGYYQAMFDHVSASGKVDNVWYEYRPQAHIADFYIIERKDPTHDLGGFGGDSGRILLMNSDNRKEYAVTNQGWCARSQPDTVTDGITCWWITAGDEHDGTNNIMGGTSFELVRCADTNVLWTLTDCRQGNTFPAKEAEALSANLCYLPSGNSGFAPLSITNENVKAERRGDAGWVMMRNIAGTYDAPGACICSGWFTNGIGTIYFDAVNSRKSVAGNKDGYKLVLEIDRYTDTWERVTMYPTVVHGTTYSDKAATTELALAETTGGKADHYFYRVHAPVVEYRPVRFRIRRTTTDTTASGDDDGFILMDNIIASVPPASATLSPYGHFNPELTGDTAVGFGGAFAVPFPSVDNHEFQGRCKVEVPPGTSYVGKPVSEYISMAQMFYRWRHLGQAEDWRMAVLEGVGTDAMTTAANLDVPGRPGDLEFYFVSVMKSDYYGYVDYARKEGSGKVSAAGYTEEITRKVSAMDPSEYGVTRLASGGTDWFVRIRDGASDYEGMTLELRGAVSNDCPMRLVENGGWRGLFAIPTNAEGTCTFRFRGRNRQTVGSADYAFNETIWGGGSEAVELPRNGVLSGGGAATPFTLDHVANYIEFRIGADASANPTWSASRAEYQNFNNWHDVWSSPGSQLFAPGTNGVDDVAMKSANLDMTAWRFYSFEDGAWDETFYLVNYNDPGFPKEQFFQSHKTPSVWNGYNLTFVSKYLAPWVEPSAADQLSGMAAKLQGQGGGILEYNKSNNPKGLENVRLTARIGQSIGYGDISYAADKSTKQNYTFLCPVSMSRSVANDDKPGDMSVGGAVSLFAYYRESKGCYEFRATRAASGRVVLLELFKWHFVNGAMQQDRLCGQLFNVAGNELRLWDNSSRTVDPGYFGMFISVENLSLGTKIIGGVWKGAADKGAPAYSTFNGSEAANGYGGLIYTDSAADKLTSGSYGVAAKDCPAEFIRPRHIDAQVATTPSRSSATTTYPGGQFFNPVNNKNFKVYDPYSKSPVYDVDDIAAGNWELGQQIEKCTNGLRTPLGLSQDVVVMLQPKNGGDWFEAGRIPVSGYALAEKAVPVHLSGDWNMRLTTGSNAVDIVIGEVRQRQWQGVDYENLNYGSTEFVYTQGVVESNNLSRAKETLLQPARGVATKPLSIRSPVLHGLGKVSFTYEDADPNAVVWVQVATNNVEYNLTGNNGYNLSVKSVEMGEPEQVGEWITIAKFGEDPETCPDGPLDRSGVKTVYLGWHDQASAPVTGLFRVFIPTNVVSEAIVLATNETQNADYGRISVTGMTVTDEPGISERSWRGWNLRTIGDNADTERRMFLDDGLIAADVGSGLTCGLNNSVNDVVSDDIATVSRQNPAIWSPTLEQVDGKSRSIGSVSFRARLYYSNDARETEVGGVISIYGAPVSTAENWKKLVDIPVTSSTFSNFTWKALGETRYRAVKIEVSGNAAKTNVPDRDRVIIDEVVLTEKLDSKIGFEYVRPFRTNLYEPVVIEDIESPNEQPLVGESWGVQTKLRLEQLGREVSGLEVYLKSFEGESPWGYEKWKERAPEMPLVQVGDRKDGIYRSVGTSSASLVQPASKSSVVQYMVILKYAGDGEETVVNQHVEKDDWVQPSWYWPVDYNEKYGGNKDPDKFSPYTILDTVSPGRAWINEVNWNDGPASETGGKLSVSNQFIEICVPSGVDMDGWYLRATDLNLNQWAMAMFGLQLPKSKVSPHATNGFEFVVVESPATQLAGGIKDPEGHSAADGAWASDGPNGSAKGGTLNYSYPWQFELVRPSGIVEHQFVLQGTNEWAEYSFGASYTGTNLVAKLNEKIPSPKRFYAVEEISKRRDGLTVGSAGVIGGRADGNPPPGGEGTWTNGLRFTAGRLNEGQVIPKDWFIAPSGTNAWVYLSVEGAHISQSIGGDTNRYVMVIVPEGTMTNVTYLADPWYETATITTRDASGATRVTPWHRRRESNYVFSPTGTTYITAIEGLDSGLDRFNIGLGPEKSKYSRAVVNWLAGKWPDATSDDIKLAHYMNLVNESVITNMTLTEMYWLDIPPVNSEGNPSDESEWWFRGGFTGIRPQAYIRDGFNGVLYTNSQFDVCLYISNDWTHVAQAPQRLQGLANERSDESSMYSGGWTSVTFKIRGMLINGEPGNKGFLPFRMFTFGPGSFAGAAGVPPFTSTIEILDPFSSASPGHSYGWDKYPNTTPFWFKWSIDTGGVPDTVSTLKAKDTYGPD